jgi:type II secretory pathway pseudopilin PulG
MTGRRTKRSGAFTLLEVSLVVGLMALLAAMVVPNFLRELEREELPGSARNIRSLLTLIAANAAFDGKRYRIRFPEEDELDLLGSVQQPIIEREDDPIDDPEAFYPVTAPWAVGQTLLGSVWCAEIRQGRPTIERIRQTRSEVQAALEHGREDFEIERLPLVFDPDGTCEWATFVLTDAPWDTDLEELEDYDRIELILEGATGLAWMQRPFYDEELDLFEENGWPAVLRQDFLSKRVLTEDDVLELRDLWR